MDEVTFYSYRYNGGTKKQIYIRAFDKREIVVNSDCGIAMEKLYDLIKADLVIKE